MNIKIFRYHNIIELEKQIKDYVGSNQNYKIEIRPIPNGRGIVNELLAYVILRGKNESN